MSSLRRELDVPIALVTASFYLVVTLLSEKFTHCNGFGDDGCAYGTWAMNFPAYAFDAKLGSYSIQRCLPSFVAWASLKALHVRLDPPHVVRAWEVMNTLCIFIGSLSWLKIARHLAIRTTMTLLGTLAMFGTYGVIKFTTWYPVLGDLWGFAFGFVALWAYLSRRLWVLVPVAIIGAFAWPSLVAPAVLLVFFWNARPAPAPAPFRLAQITGVVVALGWALFAGSLLARHYWPPTVMAVETMPYLFRLSTLVCAAYFYFALRSLADYRPFFDPRFYFRALASFPALLAIGLVFAIRTVLTRWSVPESAGFDRWFNDTGVLSTTKPAIFAVAHAVYFGPFVIVLALRWRAVCALLHQRGAGLVASAVLALVFGIDSEARHAYSFIALLFPFAIKALDDVDLDDKTLGILAVLCVVYSKLWIKLPPTVGSPSWDFPNQTVFLSQGPWMNNMMYLVQGLVVAATAVWLHRAIRRREAERMRRPASPREEAFSQATNL